MNLPNPWRLIAPAIPLLLVSVLAGCRAQLGPESGAASSREPTIVASAGATVTSAPAIALPTATPVPTATFLPTATATPTPSATPTLTPTPTATPAPLAVRLTTGGCCTQPFWSPDSTQVRFIDKRGSQKLAGIWGVDVAEPGVEPFAVSDRVEESLAQGDYLIETTANSTTIQRLSDGQRWTVPAAGRSVLISPAGAQIAWTVVNNDLPPEQQVAAVWVANLDGSGARKVATLRRGGLSGWISEDQLLVSGRESSGAREQVLSALSLVDGELKELARADRLRSPSLSPSGQWIAYYVTFAADVDQNGLWLVRSDGSERQAVPDDLFGAYQWRSCPPGGDCPPESLIVVPFNPDAEFHELWEFDPAAGQPKRLTDPMSTPFKIANGDWRVSPDGRYVAFVESEDRNIWVLMLP